MAATGSIVGVGGNRGPDRGGVNWEHSLGGRTSPGNQLEALRRPVAEVGLPRDVTEALAESGVLTVADLLAYDPVEVSRIQGVGRGSIRRVRRWLETQGLPGKLMEATMPAPSVPSRRTSQRPEPVSTELKLPELPPGLESEPVPVEVIPSRMANLFRRHGIATLGQLHKVLAGPTPLEGFGTGTRQAAIECLPQLFVAAQQKPEKPAYEPPVRREPLSEIVARLRTTYAGPVHVERLAEELGLDEDATRTLAGEAKDIVFLDPWCLLPDADGMTEAAELGSNAELGDWIVATLRRVLNPNEHEVLVRWIGLNRTPERHGEIARSLGRSRERVRQLRERSVIKVSSTPALAGSLSSLARQAMGEAPVLTDDQFTTQFQERHGQSVGATWCPGLSRLCLRASLGMRRGNVLK